MFIIIQAFSCVLGRPVSMKQYGLWIVDCGLRTVGWPAGYKTWTSFKKWTMGSSLEVHSVVRSP